MKAEETNCCIALPPHLTFAGWTVSFPAAHTFSLSSALSSPAVHLRLLIHCVQAYEDGMSNEQAFEYTKIDPWFLGQFRELHEAETWLKSQKLSDLGAEELVQLKKRGFSDPTIARAIGALSRFGRAAFAVCRQGERFSYKVLGAATGK